MSFGRNPHVAKAEAAELKASSARDDVAHEQAWREAARFWERAAERENDTKRRTVYEERAETARSHADEPREPEASASAADEVPDVAAPVEPRRLDKHSN
jgi:hypothetical protein